MHIGLGPEELGRELRGSEGPHLRRRRGIVGLYLLSSALLGTVALYQIGILKKLPQPRSTFFDTDEVNGSREAYSIFATPDAFLGLASYAMTASLAAAGAEERSQTHPWLVLGMAAKQLGDALVAAKLTLSEVKTLKAFSAYSVLTALTTWIALPLAFPEAKAAAQRLRRGDRA